MDLYNTTFFADMFRIAHWYELFAVVATYFSFLYFPKRRWIKVLGVLVITGTLGVFFRDAALHNQDFCIEQNRELSDHEKLDAAVREVIRTYPPAIIKYNFQYKNGELVGYSNKQPEQPIPYKDLKDFYAQNPGCCHLINMRNVEEGRIDFYARVRWQHSAFVEINYRVKYLDDSNTQREIMHKWSRPISHCADVLEDIDYLGY
jgi:c-di-AMP phosphodiesterase-like protein